MPLWFFINPENAPKNVLEVDMKLLQIGRTVPVSSIDLDQTVERSWYLRDMPHRMLWYDEPWTQRFVDESPKIANDSTVESFMRDIVCNPDLNTPEFPKLILFMDYTLWKTISDKRGYFAKNWPLKIRQRTRIFVVASAYSAAAQSTYRRYCPFCYTEFMSAGTYTDYFDHISACRYGLFCYRQVPLAEISTFAVASALSRSRGVTFTKAATAFGNAVYFDEEIVILGHPGEFQHSYVKTVGMTKEEFEGSYTNCTEDVMLIRPRVSSVRTIKVDPKSMANFGEILANAPGPAQGVVYTHVEEQNLKKYRHLFSVDDEIIKIGDTDVVGYTKAKVMEVVAKNIREKSPTITMSTRSFGINSVVQNTFITKVRKVLECITFEETGWGSMEHELDCFVIKLPIDLPRRNPIAFFTFDIKSYVMQHIFSRFFFDLVNGGKEDDAEYLDKHVHDPDALPMFFYFADGGADVPTKDMIAEMAKITNSMKEDHSLTTIIVNHNHAVVLSIERNKGTGYTVTIIDNNATRNWHQAHGWVEAQANGSIPKLDDPLDEGPKRLALAVKRCFDPKLDITFSFFALHLNFMELHHEHEASLRTGPNAETVFSADVSANVAGRCFSISLLMILLKAKHRLTAAQLGNAFICSQFGYADNPRTMEKDGFTSAEDHLKSIRLSQHWILLLQTFMCAPVAKEEERLSSCGFYFEPTGRSQTILLLTADIPCQSERPLPGESIKYFPQGAQCIADPSSKTGVIIFVCDDAAARSGDLVYVDFRTVYMFKKYTKPVVRPDGTAAYARGRYVCRDPNVTLTLEYEMYSDIRFKTRLHIGKVKRTQFALFSEKCRIELDEADCAALSATAVSYDAATCLFSCDLLFGLTVTKGSVDDAISTIRDHVTKFIPMDVSVYEYSWQMCNALRKYVICPLGIDTPGNYKDYVGGSDMFEKPEQPEHTPTPEGVGIDWPLTESDDRPAKRSRIATCLLFACDGANHLSLKLGCLRPTKCLNLREGHHVLNKALCEDVVNMLSYQKNRITADVGAAAAAGGGEDDYPMSDDNIRRVVSIAANSTEVDRQHKDTISRLVTQIMKNGVKMTGVGVHSTPFVWKTLTVEILVYNMGNSGGRGKIYLLLNVN